MKQKERYEVGEQVLIRKKVASNDGKSKKTLAKYSGPYVVTKISPHDRYCIEDLPGSYRSQKAYKGVSAVDHMKPFSTKVSSDETSEESNEEENDSAITRTKNDSREQLC